MRCGHGALQIEDRPRVVYGPEFLEPDLRRQRAKASSVSVNGRRDISCVRLYRTKTDHLRYDRPRSAGRGGARARGLPVWVSGVAVTGVWVERARGLARPLAGFFQFHFELSSKQV